MSDDQIPINLTEAQKAEAFWVRIKLNDDQRAEVSKAVGEEVEEIEVPVRHVAEFTPRLIIRKDLVAW